MTTDSRVATWLTIIVAGIASGCFCPPSSETVPSPEPVSSRPLRSAPLTSDEFDALSRRVVSAVSPAVVGIIADGFHQRRRTRFYGSGVCLSETGLILTSSTVAPQGAFNIKVLFEDGRLLPAAIIETSESVESTLIQVTGAAAQGGEKLAKKRLPFATLSPSSAFVDIADPVWAFGRPFLLESALSDCRTAATAGVISARYVLARNGNDQSKYLGEVIETDAGVNSGSDGGPLVDSSGRVVGIASLAHHSTRKLGTAVPIEKIIDAIPALSRCVSSQGMNHASVRVPAFRFDAERLAPCLVRVHCRRRDWTLGRLAVGAGQTDAERLAAQRLLEFSERPDGPYPGVCVDAANGYVLVASDVINDDADRIAVQPYGRTERLPAEIVAIDERLGLTLIRTRALPAAVTFAAAETATTDAIAVIGDVVNGNERRPSVTVGIRSAPSRAFYSRPSLLQLDALVNYDNLGCPVVNDHGDVIGLTVNAFRSEPLPVNSGIAFAAPAKAINDSLDILKQGRDIIPVASVYIGMVPKAGDATDGLTVGRLLSASPCADAGLLVGDVIIRIGETPVNQPRDLAALLKTKRPGDTLLVTARRGNTDFSATVRLSENPSILDRAQTAPRPFVTLPSDDAPVLSVTRLKYRFNPSCLISIPSGGSGVVISDDGEALTCYHVVETSDVVRVAGPDGESFLADVIGRDPVADIALLKIRNPSGLSAAVFEDSEPLASGSVVYAGGYPLNLSALDSQPTLAAGILSATRRQIASPQETPDLAGTPDGVNRFYANAIQFDAAVNPGNSGGALFNSDGRLIGITGMIINRFGVAYHSGVGFAIPVETIRRFLPQLRAGGTVSHGAFFFLDASRSEDGCERIIVGESFADWTTTANAGALTAAGIRAGDQLTALDGEVVETFAGCIGWLFSHPAGARVVASFKRNGERFADVYLVLDRFGQ